jgi:hypothetical protein
MTPTMLIYGYILWECRSAIFMGLYTTHKTIQFISKICKKEEKINTEDWIELENVSEQS